MFGRQLRQQIEDLQATVKSLRDRLEKVENKTEPFRVGDFGTPFFWHTGWKDPRPTVSHEEAIRMLIEHCGVQFKAIPGKRECVVLEKKPKQPA